jgi:hypothetical protein
MYEPNVGQFTTAIGLQHRTTVNVNGADDIAYTEPELEFCNWKGMGGTDSTNTGTVTVIDTATLIMWYRPDLNEQDRILLDNDKNNPYEVVNIEDIEKRHKYLQVKVKKAVGA